MSQNLFNLSMGEVIQRLPQMRSVEICRRWIRSKLSHKQTTTSRERPRWYRRYGFDYLPRPSSEASETSGFLENFGVTGGVSRNFIEENFSEYQDPRVFFQKKKKQKKFPVKIT